MTLLPIRYQVSFFTGTADLPVKSEVVSKLVQIFSKYELLPSTYQEIGPAIGPVPRIRMAHLSNEWGVDIGSQRIDIEKNVLDATGKNMGAVADFCAQALEMLSLLLKIYPRKASRVSLVTKNLLTESADGSKEKAFQALFAPLPFYQANKPFEWINRSAAESTWDNQGTVEPINVICTVSRARGMLGMAPNVVPFDRIVLDYDVNTKPEKSDSRFGPTDMEDFLGEAIDVTKKLDEQLLPLVS